jgi:hypothetical protein
MRRPVTDRLSFGCCSHPQLDERHEEPHDEHEEQLEHDEQLPQLLHDDDDDDDGIRHEEPVQVGVSCTWVLDPACGVVSCPHAVMGIATLATITPNNSAKRMN